MKKKKSEVCLQGCSGQFSICSFGWYFVNILVWIWTAASHLWGEMTNLKLIPQSNECHYKCTNKYTGLFQYKQRESGKDFWVPEKALVPSHFLFILILFPHVFSFRERLGTKSFLFIYLRNENWQKLFPQSLCTSSNSIPYVKLKYQWCS